MAEASVHIPDLSATSTVPFTEEYAGAFGFQLDLEGISELPDVWYSEELNKVYCCRCVSFPVLMNVSFPLPSGSIIRAMAVFRDPEYAGEVVTCCPHHEQLLRDSSDVDHAEHLIQVEGNEQAQYFSNLETKRHSVTVPFEEFSKSTTVWYKFMCYTSCFVNMNRRSILTIITLESPRGQVLGRRCFEVEIYPKDELPCPKFEETFTINTSSQEEKIHHLKQEEFEELGLPTPTIFYRSDMLFSAPSSIGFSMVTSDGGQVEKGWISPPLSCFGQLGPWTAPSLVPIPYISTTTQIKPRRQRMMPSESSSAQLDPRKEHFLQEHREELTRRVFGVHVILDALKINGIITEKQISEIRGTNQRKMRELYRWVPSWSTESKTEMLDILRKTNRRLLFQLQGGHFVDRHKEELIEQVTEFPLNKLHRYIRNEKQYKSLLHCATVKTKMKRLFQIVQQWDGRQKDYLYRALAKTNRPIIEMLEEEHFIEKHQEELIDQVSGIDEVLCRLQYQESPVFKDLSDRCKMRELYTLVLKWNRKQKDHLYIVLKETNGPLVAELHEGHFVERYKEELIQRVIGAKDVATSLLHFTICTHQLDNIIRKETDKEQMETLYKMVPGWNGDWKDHLYEALKETNRDLIKELMERKRSSIQGLTPYPFAKEKCLCVREKDCSEIQPTLVLDANRTLKTYRIHIPEAGTFLCSVTDLKFEVRAAVTVEYTYSSWSQHLSEFVEPDWIVAGPVFDIHADPAEVAAVHLPHFICLQGGSADTSRMKIGHIVDAGIMLEKPSHISPFHAVLKNPSFSLLGVLINPIYNKFFPVHSVVQLYKICKKTTTLHLYLIPNDGSLIQAIKEEEEKYNSILVRKHPQTNKPLYFGSHYHISSSINLTVNPKELEFSYKRPEQLQSFLEIYIKNCRRMHLSLKNKDNRVWDAWLEQEDLQNLTETTAKKQRTQQASRASGTQHQEKELHFIEVHREALIQRTVNVEGIMDMLYGARILDLEQYQKVLSRGTNQEKMRELYQFVPSWNYSCKDQCYEALKMKNRFLIEDLEEKD